LHKMYKSQKPLNHKAFFGIKKFFQGERWKLTYFNKLLKYKGFICKRLFLYANMKGRLYRIFIEMYKKWITPGLILKIDFGYIIGRNYVKIVFLPLEYQKGLFRRGQGDMLNVLNISGIENQMQ
jgi:hypothetical protein